MNGSHRFVFFYVAVITAGVLAFVLNMHTSVLPSFRPMTVPISFFKYILLSAELPRYASMFVIGRTHQSLSASLFARSYSKMVLVTWGGTFGGVTSASHCSCSSVSRTDSVRNAPSSSASAITSSNEGSGRPSCLPRRSVSETE